MALPVTITGLLVATTNNDTVSKPFISSAGNVYVVGKGTTTNLLRAFKATDPTSSFSNVGTDVTMTSTNAIQAVDAVQQGDLLHVITTDAAAATAVDLRYHVFDMSSDTWTTSNETVVNDYAVVAIATAIHAAVSIRSDGDVIVLYNGPLVNISAADRETVYYARRESGSWTVNVEVSNAGATSWYAGGVVLGSSDRMHFFFLDDGASDAYQRCLTSANSLETFPSAIDTTVNTTQISALQTGTSYVSGANTKVRYPWEDATGIILMSFKCDSADAPTMSKDDGIDGAVPCESGAHRNSMSADGTRLWCAYVFATDSDIYTLSNANDAGWDAPALFAVENSNGIRTNIYTRSGSVVLAMVYNSSSNTLYNEKVLATAAAFDQDVTASVTWTGEAVAAGGSAWSSTATASVTWSGASTATSNLDSDATALLTWNGRSFAASAFDQDAAASLTWVGSSITAASATDWSSAATASLTWNGAAISASRWIATASSAAFGGVVGASTAAGPLSAAAVASLTWNGVSTSASAWDADALTSVTWTGVDAGGAVEDGDASLIAAASVTFSSASTADSAVAIDVAAVLAWAGVDATPAVGLSDIDRDGWKPRRKRIVDAEDEELMVLVTAIYTYMEQNHVYH